MFFHSKQLQYRVRVEKPDPVYAKQLQELIGGKFGEMTVMNQYLFQAWAIRGDLQDPRMGQFKDMLLDTGTEEIGHIEMLATCVAQLLDGTSPEQQEEAAASNPLVYAALGGMNPQHMIMSGLAATPQDSVGNPWNGMYATASGNVPADMYANAMAEMQGRIQACRLYEMTKDAGVRDMLSFLIARDRMHQNQWLAAIEELGGPTQILPIPVDFPGEKEFQEVGYAFMSFSRDADGSSSSKGRWAHGPSIDGKGQFSFVGNPQPLGEVPHLKAPPPTIHSAIPGQLTSPEPDVETPGHQDETVVEKVTRTLGGK